MINYNNREPTPRLAFATIEITIRAVLAGSVIYLLVFNIINNNNNNRKSLGRACDPFCRSSPLSGSFCEDGTPLRASAIVLYSRVSRSMCERAAMSQAVRNMRSKNYYYRSRLEYVCYVRKKVYAVHDSQ